MEEMRKVAKAYFKVASKEVKQMAREFFNSMDDNNDNLISLEEFVAFMNQEGYSRMSNSHFFEKLNLDKSGNLDFWDVMTLYYIVKSGRPFCGRCGDLILDALYFTCVECFHTKDDTFNLCFGCFVGKKIVHEHTNFLDNCALLEPTRKKALAEAEPTKDKKKGSKRQRIAKKVKNWSSHKAQPRTDSTSKAIVPASNMIGQSQTAFKALELAVRIVAIASTTMQCSIL